MKTKNLMFLLTSVLLSFRNGGGCATMNDQQWIERLKSTPVAKIEAGLPEQSFADWFAAQVNHSEPQYEAVPCPEQQGTCVKVSTTINVHRVEMVFLVATVDAAGNAKPIDCQFLSGSYGPADPRMKFPTRKLSKLSDLPKLLHGQN